MKNIKIKTRLFIGFGLLILFASIISLIAFLSISALSNDINDLAKKRIPETVASGNIAGALSHATVNLQKAFLTEDEETMQKSISDMLETRKTITDNFNYLKVTVKTEQGKEILQRMIDSRKPVAETRDRTVKLLREGNKKEALQMLHKLEPLQQAYTKAVEDMGTDIQESAKQSGVKAESNASTSRMMIIILSLMAVALAVVVTLWIIQSIVKPLNEAVEIAAKISTGDLTVQIDNTNNNETGQLLIAMKAMVDKLKCLIGDIKQASSSVASGSEQLSASSEQITRTMTDQSNRSTQIATSAEEMSQTIFDIAKSASEIAASSSETAKTARNGEEVVNKSVAESKTIVEIVSASAFVMQSLGEKSMQIGDVVAVIKDIAEQTNLLALNAAIEAARAGDQGRGFAVVADEVRKLSERTSKATSEIRQMIGSIQDEVGKAVETMENTNEKVNVGLQYSLEAGEQLTTIVQSVMSLQGMVQQIASATEEMSTTSESISGDIQSVAGGAKEISGGSDQIAQSSSELARLAGQLKYVVDQFRV